MLSIVNQLHKNETPEFFSWNYTNWNGIMVSVFFFSCYIKTLGSRGQRMFPRQTWWYLGERLGDIRKEPVGQWETSCGRCPSLQGLP